MSIASVFKSAVTEADGVTINVGYLALYSLAVMVLGAIPALIIGTFAAMYFDPFHHFDSKDVGIAIGAICTGYATTVGAVGLFLKGDRAAVQPSSSTTTVSTTTT